MIDSQSAACMLQCRCPADVLSSPSSGTGTVHGMVVGQVSPIKSSLKREVIKYFDGQFTDR